MQYIADWETANKSAGRSPQEQRKMGLSAETIEGLIITGITIL